MRAECLLRHGRHPRSHLPVAALTLGYQPGPDGSACRSAAAVGDGRDAVSLAGVFLQGSDE